MRHEYLTLDRGILASLAEHASRPAIVVGDARYTYAEVAAEAFGIAQALAAHVSESPYTAVLGCRSKGAYTGILGTLLAGKAYMPLNPRFPADRLRSMLKRAACTTLVLSDECVATFRDLEAGLAPLTVICPAPAAACRGLATEMPRHRFVFPSAASTPPPRAETAPAAPAYLLFTSGSTGLPKGVAVTQGNVCAYLRQTIERYGVNPEDRASQMFDLTFDLSVHDIFVTLLAGACLCVVPEAAVMGPARFIKEQQLTLWFSVPSVVMFMERMRMLKPGGFASLRCSLFCGEALPRRSAELWQAAAPGSLIENLYGPTEATIAITRYRWQPDASPAACVNGIVPIGLPFDGHLARVTDEQGLRQPVGAKGELCVGGPQVAPGYLDSPPLTAERFVRFDDTPDMPWYRTGDLVMQDAGGCLYYLGRRDDQIKIRGYRVELQEIDHAIRNAAGTDLAVCVPRRINDQVDSLAAFVQAPEDAALRQRILAGCQRVLPDYMVPARIRFVDRMPLNANGKIDRTALGGLDV